MLAATATATATTPRWSIFELTLTGPPDSDKRNAFQIGLNATFKLKAADLVLTVNGFYDGGSTYKVRFAPPQEGDWNYAVSSDEPSLHGHAGELTATAPTPGDHGPVQSRGFGLVHADGMPHLSIGTTSYQWASKGFDMQRQTLATLKTSPFNKMRMTVFPKWYVYNHANPVETGAAFPIRAGSVAANASAWGCVGHACPSLAGSFDLKRFNVSFFRNYERLVRELGVRGVVADIILFHPYASPTPLPPWLCTPPQGPCRVMCMPGTITATGGLTASAGATRRATTRPSIRAISSTWSRDSVRTPTCGGRWPTSGVFVRVRRAASTPRICRCVSARAPPRVLAVHCSIVLYLHLYALVAVAVASVGRLVPRALIVRPIRPSGVHPQWQSAVQPLPPVDQPRVTPGPRGQDSGDPHTVYLLLRLRSYSLQAPPPLPPSADEPHAPLLACGCSRYAKPVIWDEVRYEGDIPESWGALSGAEEAARYWGGAALGVYVGHSETLLRDGVTDDQQPLWWAKGGELIGSSPDRIRWFGERWREALGGLDGRVSLGELRPSNVTFPPARHGQSPVANVLNDTRGGTFFYAHFLRAGVWSVPLPRPAGGAGKCWHLVELDYWTMESVERSLPPNATSVSVTVAAVPSDMFVSLK